MRKTWKKPEAKLELFQANEVIAACLNLQCLVPTENGGFDPVHPEGSSGANNFLHSPNNCGAADGTVVVTDENNNIVSIEHTKKRGSTGACATFADSSFSTPKSTLVEGEMLYWITVSADGNKSWRHHGVAQLAGNHS